MVRINLLPDRKQAKTRSQSEPGQLWLFAVLGVILLEIILLIVVHKLKTDQLKTAQGENDKIVGQVDEIKRTIANHEDIKTQLKELRDREEAISKLQSGRTGPTATLMELSHILSPGRGPTVDQATLERMKLENAMGAMNANWDGKRVWLTQYNEVERQVKVQGLAKDGEDVSEFQRRLELSNYFYDVKLLPGARVRDERTKQDVVKFEFSAKVRY